MDIFWILHLAILTLLHQTSMYEASCEADETTMAALAGARNTKMLMGVLGEPVTLRVNTTDENPALWCYGNHTIVTVAFNDSHNPEFHNNKYKSYCNVSEKGHTLTVTPQRMENAGIYYAKINKTKFYFILSVFRKLPELTVPNEAQKSSDGSCHHNLQCSLSGTDFSNSTDFGNISYSWWAGDQLLAEGPKLPVNESLLGMRKPLMCVARNPVSSRNVTVTNLGVLCAANTTVPSSTGANSNSWIWIFIIFGIVVVLLLIFCVPYCKSRVTWMKGRFWTSVGSQDDSDGAAGDMDTQAESPV